MKSNILPIKSQAQRGVGRPEWPVTTAQASGLAFAAVIAGLAARPVPTAAQGLNPLGPSRDAQPINITAQSGIEWQQDKQIYVARGNAVATRGTSEVHADTLTAHYRPSKNKSAEGGNEVYRLDADGNVLIKGPNQTVVGDQAIYDVDQQIGIVTGKHLKMTTPTDVVTARDSLEWYDQQQVAVARGDAIAVRGDRRIRADVLTAHFVKDKSEPGAAQPGTKSKPGEPAAAKTTPDKTRRRPRQNRAKAAHTPRRAPPEARSIPVKAVRRSAGSTPKAMSSSSPRPMSAAAITGYIMPRRE